MKDLIVYGFILLVMCFFLLGAKLSFKPFSLTFERPWCYALGILFVFIGISLVYWAGGQSAREANEKNTEILSRVVIEQEEEISRYKDTIADDY